MPLVRIDLRKGKHPAFGPAVGKIVFESMVAEIQVPKEDHFQVIRQHDETELIYDPSYLGIERTDGIIFIQITLNEGRTLEMKRALYARIAARLQAELGVRTEDVLINLVEVKKENWSFGNGVAQYAV